MNFDAVVNRVFADVEQRYSFHDTIVYALSAGFGTSRLERAFSRS